MRDRCLNYLSYSYKIATCSQPLRCLHCHGYSHLARDCKRPRSPPADGSNNAAGQECFIRAHRVPGSTGTPVGSQASGSTPASNPPLPACPTLEERDPLPPGHPDERQWVNMCIIQRSTAVDNAEASMRLAIMAVAADATREISAYASRALRSIHGVEEASFSITPFYLENFLIRCLSQETRDRILVAPPVPVAGTVLVLRGCAPGRAWRTQRRHPCSTRWLSSLRAFTTCLGGGYGGQDPPPKLLDPRHRAADGGHDGPHRIQGFSMDMRSARNPQGGLALHHRE